MPLARRVVSLGGILLLTSCVRAIVEARAPGPSPTQMASRTVWIYAWGLARTPKLTAECGDNHIARATISQTLPGFLLALVTVGIVVPARIHYICNVTPADIQGPAPQ